MNFVTALCFLFVVFVCVFFKLQFQTHKILVADTWRPQRVFPDPLWGLDPHFGDQ